jgi:hypothetical protein
MSDKRMFRRQKSTAASNKSLNPAHVSSIYIFNISYIYCLSPYACICI